MVLKTAWIIISTHKMVLKYALGLKILAKMYKNIKVWFVDLNFGTFGQYITKKRIFRKKTFTLKP